MALADEQAAFVRAATSGGEGVYGRLLEAKRRSELAACLPALVEALGPRFTAEFALWWRGSAHDHANFRAALLAAGYSLLAVIEPQRRAAVRRDLLRWELSGRGPFARFGDGSLWFRLTPGGRLHRWRI